VCVCVCVCGVVWCVRVWRVCVCVCVYVHVGEACVRVHQDRKVGALAGETAALAGVTIKHEYYVNELHVDSQLLHQSRDDAHTIDSLRDADLRSDLSAHGRSCLRRAEQGQAAFQGEFVVPVSSPTPVFLSSLRAFCFPTLHLPISIPSHPHFPIYHLPPVPHFSFPDIFDSPYLSSSCPPSLFISTSSRQS